MDLRNGRVFVRLHLVKLTYGPPGAPWVEDDDESVYPLVLRRSADVLVERLEQRISILRREPMDVDVVTIEMRRLIAASAIDDPIGASDLVDMLLELLRAKENAKRPF